MVKVLKTTRVDEKVRNFDNVQDFNKKTRISVFGTNISALDVSDRELINRYRNIVRIAVPDLANAKLPWSRNAGCSCGCSPGFILDHRRTIGGKPTDIYIDVICEEA